MEKGNGVNADVVERLGRETYFIQHRLQLAIHENPIIQLCNMVDCSILQFGVVLKEISVCFDDGVVCEGLCVSTAFIAGCDNLVRRERQ